MVVALTEGGGVRGADNPNIATDGILPTRGLPRTRLQGMVLNQVKISTHEPSIECYASALYVIHFLEGPDPVPYAK